MDLDTTSVALMVTQPDDHVFDSVMDEMLQYTTSDGIMMVSRLSLNISRSTPAEPRHLRQTYFDAERPRTDPIVSLNILRLFYSRGRGDELSHTLDWVLAVLEHRAYLDGTRYYETAECFLYFASQLLLATSDAPLHARLAPLLRTRILERAGANGDALALAMRVLAGIVVGLRLEQDLAQLLPLQLEDGGWGPGWMYKYGSANIKIGNRGLTTALALKAISALQSPPPSSPPPKFEEEEPLLPPSPVSLLPVCKEREDLEREPLTPLQLRSPRPAIGKPVKMLRLPSIRGLPLGLPSPSPSPPPPPPPMSPVKTKREWRISAGTLAKNVYAYLFTTTHTTPSRRVHDVGVGIRRHRRGGSTSTN